MKKLVVLAIVALSCVGFNAASASAANCSESLGKPYSAFGNEYVGVSSYCTGNVDRIQYGGQYTNDQYFYDGAGLSVLMNVAPFVQYTTYVPHTTNSSAGYVPYVLNCAIYSPWLQAFVQASINLRIHNYGTNTWGSWHRYNSGLGGWC